MSLASVANVFAGATVGVGATPAAGDLLIPSGTITSFTPSSETVPGGVEMIYGLLETLNAKVVAEGAGTTRLTASASSRLVGDTILRRTYSFTVDLDFSDALLADLNVADEPV